MYVPPYLLLSEAIVATANLVRAVFRMAISAAP